MAAPTPVSSLVHSSTLVTAGVYLFIRYVDFFFWMDLLRVLFYLGSLTLVVARLAAIQELDIKKIVALSTLRQLGLIVLCIGLN